MHGRGVCLAVGGACMAVGMHAWQGGGACVAGEMATAAGSTHPTGMHSCLSVFQPVNVTLVQKKYALSLKIMVFQLTFN